MEVQETIRRLRDKAVHPSTPANEAETCSRMASKLETRHHFAPSEPKRPAPPRDVPTPAGWSETQVSLARSLAIGRAYKLFGTQFDVAAWEIAYGKAVTAQKAAKVRFDAALAYEHGLEQYDKVKQKVAEPKATESDLSSLTDLDLAAEMVRLSHVVLDYQARLSYVKENGSFTSLFGRTTAVKNMERVQGNLSREFHTSARRMREVEAEIEGRRKLANFQPDQAVVEEPVAPSYRFIPNPS